MPSTDLRDKLVLPIAATVCSALIVAAIVTAAKTSLFWAVAGAVAAVAVMTIIVVLYARTAKLAARLDDTGERAAVADHALNELSAAFLHLQTRLAVSEIVAVPEWLRVAIDFQTDRGNVRPETRGIRFEDREGHEIMTVHIPWANTDAETWARDELHKRLGIGQLEYMRTLLGPQPTDPPQASDEGEG
jgi:hypothetical protein